MNYLHFKLHNHQCVGSGSAWVRIDFGRLDPDPEQGGKNTKIGEEIYCFESDRCSLLRAGLRASPVPWISSMEVL
jgi:hypothetical protein